MKLRTSLEGKVALLTGAAAVSAAAITAVSVRAFDSLVAGLCLSLVVTVPLTLYAVRRFMRPVNRLITALGDGVASFRDGDFSISLNAKRQDELGELARHYNAAGDILRRERHNLFQRELLLDTVIQSTPWALVLVNSLGRVVYSNTAARRMFGEGRKLEGYSFPERVQNMPEPLREAVAAGRDGMFGLQQGEEDDIYYLSHERFTLNAQRHDLYVFKQLTRELNRQEVAIWKKVIRVISHELNNSLAPISSLAHSGRILSQPPVPERIGHAFATIEERAAHLKIFIDGYARFAKLPAPTIQAVEWEPFIASLREMAPFHLLTPVPQEPARFDRTQMQQVLINLLKNAHESGSPPDAVTLAVHAGPQGVQMEVGDAGPGMAPEVLEQALLPFYSTKQSGTGLGLPLCREIAEAHGGRLSLANRPTGGLTVRLWLPILTEPPH